MTANTVPQLFRITSDPAERYPLLPPNSWEEHLHSIDEVGILFVDFFNDFFMFFFVIS